MNSKTSKAVLVVLVVGLNACASLGGSSPARASSFGVKWERDGMPCEPLLFVDGASQGRLTAKKRSELQSESPHARTTIYRAGREPAAYRDPQKCGAVVTTTH
jgi:hypothetical protein